MATWSTSCRSCARAAGLLALLLGVATPARAADPRQRALIVDLTTSADKNSSTPTVISVDADQLSCSSGTPPATLMDRLAKACGDDQKQDDVLAALEASGCLRPKSNLRWVSRRGDLLQVYVFYPDDRPRPRIAYHEDDRQSRIASDFATLLKIALALARGRLAEAAPGVACSRGTYGLERLRANLKVTVTQAASDAESAADAMPAEHKAEVTLTTGPVEHWFLSADLPVRRTNELQFDSATNTLKPAQTPSQFYIGVDYMIGDLLHDPGNSPLLGNLVIKGMFKASKNPMESFGIAIGLRGSYVLNLDMVSPFVGYVFTRADPDAPPDAADSGKFSGTLQIGASFNLDQALAWLKGGQK
jgi:hypothetical protein